MPRKEQLMKPTFYIASSSHAANISKVRALAENLEQMGFEWALDWTKHLDASAKPAQACDPQAAENDIEAARSCNLFVFLCSDVNSRGAHIELGARLAVKKVAHIVLGGREPYFFYHHPLVSLYTDPIAFFEMLQKEESS